mgnify:CR=1 FL=1
MLKLKIFIVDFVRDETGAVTIDFVLLTGAIVGLGLAVVTMIIPSLNPVASGVEPVLLAAPTAGSSKIVPD